MTKKSEPPVEEETADEEEVVAAAAAKKERREQAIDYIVRLGFDKNEWDVAEREYVRDLVKKDGKPLAEPQTKTLIKIFHRLRAAGETAVLAQGGRKNYETLPFIVDGKTTFALHPSDSLRTTLALKGGMIGYKTIRSDNLIEFSYVEGYGEKQQKKTITVPEWQVGVVEFVHKETGKVGVFEGPPVYIEEAFNHKNRYWKVSPRRMYYTATKTAAEHASVVHGDFGDMEFDAVPDDLPDIGRAAGADGAADEKATRKAKKIAEGGGEGAETKAETAPADEGAEKPPVKRRGRKKAAAAASSAAGDAPAESPPPERNSAEKRASAAKNGDLGFIPKKSDTAPPSKGAGAASREPPPNSGRRSPPPRWNSDGDD